ncbi:SRPBCC family protein, partial [Streptomyces vietnamensis]|uniref:SRPBCC family protein n=3 Tax=Actinomycetes TaxID=1760 RepID=UPI00378DFBA2
ENASIDNALHISALQLNEAAGRVNNDRLGRIMARIRQVARNLTPIASLKTKRFEPHHLNTGRPDLHFMSGVREIRQTDDVHTQWILEIAGQTREFDATITEQHPDERIAWKSDAGSISLTVFRRISISKFQILANDRRT